MLSAMGIRESPVKNLPEKMNEKKRKRIFPDRGSAREREREISDSQIFPKGNLERERDLKIDVGRERGSLS